MNPNKVVILPRWANPYWSMQPGLLLAQAPLGSHRPPLFLLNCISTVHASKQCELCCHCMRRGLSRDLLGRSPQLFMDIVLQTAQYILPSADLMYIRVALSEKWMSCEELKYGNILKLIDRNPIANVLKRQIYQEHISTIPRPLNPSCYGDGFLGRWLT